MTNLVIIMGGMKYGGWEVELSLTVDVPIRQCVEEILQIFKNSYILLL